MKLATAGFFCSGDRILFNQIFATIMLIIAIVEEPNICLPTT